MGKADVPKASLRKAIQSEDGGSNEECVWWGGLNERERVGREAVWKQYNDAVSSNSNRRAATADRSTQTS
jgi:hypothetical protein